MKQKRKGKVGVFIVPGGNDVFFANGVLKVLNQENITFDHYFGYSSSSTTIFTALFHCEDLLKNLYVQKVKKNKRNLYFFPIPHFRHQKMYEELLHEILEKYSATNKTNYTIIAAKTSKRFMRIKALIGTFCLVSHLFIGSFPLEIYKRIFKIEPLLFTGKKTLKKEEIMKAIIGSSSVYPVVKPQIYNDHLILEGEILKPTYETYLKGFDKKVVIHFEKGETRVEKGVLHIHPKQKTPFNVVSRFDNTNERRIIKCHKMGEVEAKRSLKLIRDYVKGE